MSELITFGFAILSGLVCSKGERLVDCKVVVILVDVKCFYVSCWQLKGFVGDAAQVGLVYLVEIEGLDAQVCILVVLRRPTR